MFELLHKGCGGRIYTRSMPSQLDLLHNNVYIYITDSGKVEFHEPLFCDRCHKEILGDAETEIEGEKNEKM